MSGSPPNVQLYGNETWKIVHAIPRLEEILKRPVVIVGGLAVLCRIGTAYRVTTDIDVVNRRDADAVSQLDVLVQAGAQRVEPAGAILATSAGDVRVDVLEISTRDLEDLPDDPTGRLHVLAHEWARETASTVQIGVLDVGNTVPFSAVARVSEPGPIVAMKLQSLPDRPSAKESTDLLDIVRLTLAGQTASTVHEQLSTASGQIRADAALHVQQWFVQNAHRTLMRIKSVPDGATIDRVAVDLVGELLLAALSDNP